MEKIIEPKTNTDLFQSGTVLWAVDPAELDLVPELENFRRIRSLFGGPLLTIKPVYICSDRDVVLADAQKMVQEFIRGIPYAKASAIEVIYSDSNKKSDLAAELLNIAHQQGAEMILLLTRGHSALGGLLVGSFAAELLKQSNLPVLFLRPPDGQVQECGKILFTTDFSDESKLSFHRIIQMIKGKHIDLILFHTVTMPLQSTGFAEGMGYLPQIPDYFIEEEKEGAESELERWQQEAQAAGVRLTIRRMVTESLTSPAATIVRVANDENVFLIALASHRGSSGLWNFGSVTQEVVAEKKFNIWACGPNIKKEKFR